MEQTEFSLVPMFRLAMECVKGGRIMTTRTKEALAIIHKEQAAYELQKECLERHHMGEWVVFHDEELAGIYDNLQDAAEDALHRFGLGPYLIKQVGMPQPRIRQLLYYTPVDDDESSP